MLENADFAEPLSRVLDNRLAAKENANNKRIDVVQNIWSVDILAMDMVMSKYIHLAFMRIVWLRMKPRL